MSPVVARGGVARRPVRSGSQSQAASERTSRFVPQCCWCWAWRRRWMLSHGDWCRKERLLMFIPSSAPVCCCVFCVCVWIQETTASGLWSSGCQCAVPPGRGGGPGECLAAFYARARVFSPYASSRRIGGQVVPSRALFPLCACPFFRNSVLVAPRTTTTHTTASRVPAARGSSLALTVQIANRGS